MYKESLLIAAIVLIIIGAAILTIGGFARSEDIGLLFLICGVALFILWIVLYAIVNARTKGG